MSQPASHPIAPDAPISRQELAQAVLYGLFVLYAIKRELGV